MSEWKSLREQAGMTLAELAAQSGYSIGTINGLELHGEGSARLKAKLREILTPLPSFPESVNQGRAESVKPPLALHDAELEYNATVRLELLAREQLENLFHHLSAEVQTADPERKKKLFLELAKLTHHLAHRR